MTAIKVVPPTAQQIKANPRAFALYKQLDVDGKGIDPAALAEAVRKYGSGNASSVKGELSYEDLAALLTKEVSPPLEGAGNAVGYAARDKSGHLAPFKFTRRPVGPTDISIKITNAGICHSDLHQIKDEWGGSAFPMVPGHEIVGIVTEVGGKVEKFKVGDRAGIGCFVRACHECDLCEIGDDHYCAKAVFTYNGKDWGEDGNPTYGGYSDHIVVDSNFALKVPTNLSMAAAAPLLCAGITVWSPMHYYHLSTRGQKLGVVGLGGLGHMAVKFGKALGLEVTVISTSPRKEKEACEVLGADHFIVSKDDQQMAAAVKSLDGIIDTVSAKHEISSLLALLKNNGKLVLLGAPPEPHTFRAQSVLFSRLTIGGSLIGGIKETQEMLDFCGEKGITCEVEEIPIDYVNTAMERLVKNDVHYRFSIDIQGSLA